MDWRWTGGGVDVQHHYCAGVGVGLGRDCVGQRPGLNEGKRFVCLAFLFFHGHGPMLVDGAQAFHES